MFLNISFLDIRLDIFTLQSFRERERERERERDHGQIQAL